jgi:hypothetical protein
VAGVLELAAEHARVRRRVAAAATLAAVRAWRGMAGADLATSWTMAGPRIYSAAYAGQLAAASTATGYITGVLDAQDGSSGPATDVVDPAAFAGFASDGRSLLTLLRLPLARTFTDLSAGLKQADALARGEALLRMFVDTEVADAGRAADSTAITADHRAKGYVRVVSASACGRCIVLAGRHYRYSAGFARHPHCHCQQMPVVSAGQAAEHLTDPHAAFEHLSHEQQDRAFTVSGAKAIRDGADIGQVVNARRGMYTAHIFGRDVKATTEGATRHSLYKKAVRKSGRPAPPVRLTPDAIYRIAADRADAVRLLRRYGYLL